MDQQRGELMTEGEAGDAYVVIESGRVEVTAADVVLGREGPGQGVGEIALLEDAPRTATVTAIDPVAAWIVDRTPTHQPLASPRQV